jgi:hypothetical protein
MDFLYNFTHSDGYFPLDNSQPLGDMQTFNSFPCQLVSLVALTDLTSILVPFFFSFVPDVFLFLQSVTINGGRPPLVKFAAVMAVIVNWTSTLFIFVMTCESLLMRRGYMLSVSSNLTPVLTFCFPRFFCNILRP